MQKKDYDILVSLAGNPNVGKSTIFNRLTGMRQHTGNWAGKTVDTAYGIAVHNGKRIKLVDLPGSYSLLTNSGEEEVARDFICFGGSDANVVVCDATAIERNLGLLLQVLEISPHTILCVNLIDEAAKKGIQIDTAELSRRLKIPVVATSGRSGKGIDALLDEIVKMADIKEFNRAFQPKYSEELESAIKKLSSPLIDQAAEKIGLTPRYLKLRILENDTVFLSSLKKFTGIDLGGIIGAEHNCDVSSEIASCLMKTAERLRYDTVHSSKTNTRDRKIDRVLTNKFFGPLIMLLMLAVIFWITISGANYPSTLLSDFFFSLEGGFYNALSRIGLPTVICDIIVYGVYRVVAWIVSVMLPPMAIFFPLFTLLEDLGVLPRIAFNLDRCFEKCRTCGKQALTMCMGFGCNAAGVIGCRIIDSPRERMIAMLTNSLVPCNGRFPTLITLISLFFIGGYGLISSVGAALVLCLFIILSVVMTFLSSALLSRTLLKGMPSSFTLELPPYRRPQVLKILLRSIFERTLFVLGRAVYAAVPAGLIIWFAANITVDGSTILQIVSDFLDPVGRLMGLDGVILIAFILGFPANEIVVPLIVMGYLSTGTLNEITDMALLGQLFASNGWTQLTALNVMLFSLFHWPCATTVMTLKKETGSVGWTALGVLLPTVIGFILCVITNGIYALIT